MEPLDIRKFINPIRQNTLKTYIKTPSPRPKVRFKSVVTVRLRHEQKLPTSKSQPILTRLKHKFTARRTRSIRMDPKAFYDDITKIGASNHSKPNQYQVLEKLLPEEKEENDVNLGNIWHVPRLSRRKRSKRERKEKRIRYYKRKQTLLADSGTTHTLVTPDVQLENEVPDNGLTIKVANNTTMKSKSRGTLPLADDVSVTAYKCPHVTESLLSLGNVNDQDCVTIMDNEDIKVVRKKDVKIKLSGIPVIQSKRDYDGLFRIPVPKGGNSASFKREFRLDKALVNSAYQQRSKEDLAKFLHGCAGYPVITLFIAAILLGTYASWPGLDPKLIRKYLEKSDETTMGHMKATRMGTRSTKRKQMEEEESEKPLDPPRSHLQLQKNHQVCAAGVVSYEELKGLICTDLPGRFPVQSFYGNEYIFVMYDYDSNLINAVPIKSRSKKHILEGYETVYKTLIDAGIQPELQRLDNEISKELIASIKEKNLKHQISTAYDHCQNLAERAI